jgi:hypothetical protein
MATLKNTTINDTGHVTVAIGTTAQRPASPTIGMLRYNTTTGTLETYTAQGVWGGLEAPPVVSSVSGIINTDTDTTLTITGANFISGAIVYVTGDGVPSSPRALTTTFVSATQLTANTGAASTNYTGGGAWSLFVINPSGNLSGTVSGGVVDRDAVWSTASGSLATVYDSQRSGWPGVTVSATDPDGTVVYNVESGSLPPGTSLNTSTGAITGTLSGVGSDTTYSFTLGATNSGGLKTLRSFSITVNAPVVVSYTSTGSTTFSVPTGLTSVRVMAVGGGGGGATRGGGGGAGGMIVHNTFPVTPGGSVPVTVGGGGAGMPSTPTDGAQPDASDGSNSVFGTITARGGGGGASHRRTGRQGGSGGGAGRDAGNTSAGGTSTGNQAAGGTAYGNSGGGSPAPGSSNGGGGGGASQAGFQGGALAGNSNTPMYNGASGGGGRSDDISGSSVTYAGGGGSGCDQGNTAGAGGSGGGGRGGGTQGAATGGTTNTGGGGGSNGDYSPASTGSGGSGIVIIKY